MIKNKTEFVELRQNYYEHQYRQRLINNLNRQAEKLGLTLVEQKTCAIRFLLGAGHASEIKNTIYLIILFGYDSFHSGTESLVTSAGRGAKVRHIDQYIIYHCAMAKKRQKRKSWLHDWKLKCFSIEKFTNIINTSELKKAIRECRFNENHSKKTECRCLHKHFSE